MSDEITKNLSTFSFGTSVEEDDDLKNLLSLRDRSYFLSCNMIAHATYFVGFANEIHKNISDKQKRFKIGFIGCGRIACHMINSLIEYSDIKPKHIYVTSRKSESLPVEFKEQGVWYCENKLDVVKNVTILFLCCLPSNVEEILRQVKDHVKHCFIYSFVAGIPVSKISHLIQSNKVYKPNYHFNEDATFMSNVEMHCDVKKALAIVDIREITCPVGVSDIIKPVEIDREYMFLLLNVPLIFPSMGNCTEVANLVLKLIYDNLHSLKNYEKFTTLLEKWYGDKEFNTVLFDEFKNELLNMMNEDENILSQKTRYKSFFDRFSSWSILS